MIGNDSEARFRRNNLEEDENSYEKMHKILKLKLKIKGFEMIEETGNNHLMAYEPEDVISMERDFQMTGNVYLEEILHPENLIIFVKNCLLEGTLEGGDTFHQNCVFEGNCN